MWRVPHWRASTPTKWKPFWVTNMLRASLSRCMAAFDHIAPRWLGAALAVVLFCGVAQSGQATSEAVVTKAQSGPANLAPAESNLPKPSVVALQQRVARYDPNYKAAEPAASGPKGSEAEAASTLHVLVGRSLFINTPQRL